MGLGIFEFAGGSLSEIDRLTNLLGAMGIGEWRLDKAAEPSKCETDIETGRD